MKRLSVCLAAAALFAVCAPQARAQAPAAEWNPPSTEMPAMPSMAELSGNWRAAVGPWLAGCDRVAQVSAADIAPSGEAARGGPRSRFVRFVAGARPVATWTDRNGDGRADMIEIFRSGAAVVQMVDPDFDGRANVLRLYDASGGLARETRL